jgi:protein phosphatase
MSRTPRLTAAGATDVGRVREQNEDCYALHPELGLAVLADGMGGHQAGEVAATLATDTIVQRLAHRERGLRPAPTRGRRARAKTPPQLMAEALAAANTAVYRAAQARPEYRGMGATVVVAVLAGTRLYFAHAGDSRLYRLRDGALEQLTQDHSLVQDLVTRGLFTPEEARHSPAKNVVTRALGVDAVLEPELGSTAVAKGDVYLLCSDGLTDVVSDPEIAGILADAADPRTAVQRLVERANALGGPDNISVVVLRLDP